MEKYLPTAPGVGHWKHIGLAGLIDDGNMGN
jgi:hypothetical protein